MTSAPLVLDAAGLDGSRRERPPELLRALLAEALRRGREVITPTVVCAEVARGRARTRALEAAVSRHDATRAERPPLRLVDTDFALARQRFTATRVAKCSSPSATSPDAQVVGRSQPPPLLPLPPSPSPPRTARRPLGRFRPLGEEQDQDDDEDEGSQADVHVVSLP